jgi:D-alanine-D-alanine ligase
VLPLVEIKPRRGFYDYTAKYTSGQSDYICPAELDEQTTGLIQRHALTVYRELDLGPYSRIDCLLDKDGVPWFLEANTLPGFTALSLLPRSARAAGIDFLELLELLMLCALERHETQKGRNNG